MGGNTEILKEVLKLLEEQWEKIECEWGSYRGLEKAIAQGDKTEKDVVLIRRFRDYVKEVSRG